MVLAVVRKCRRYIYLILGIVLATVIVTCIFPDPMVTLRRESILTHEQSQKTLRKLSLNHIPDEAVVTALYHHGDAAGSDENDMENFYDAYKGLDNQPSNDGDNNNNEGDDINDGVPDTKKKDIHGGKKAVDNPAKHVKMGKGAKYDQMKNSHKKKDMKVIILTYMRSGSTLTGDFFQHHPDVFYMFEPLWRIQKYYMNQSQVIYNLKGQVIRQTHPIDVFWTRHSLSTTTLQNVLNCRTQDLDTGTLSMAHLASSKCTKPYHYCIQFHPMRKSVKAIIECLSLLQRPCLNAKVTIVKTIRYTINQLEEILAADPDVKVIHLFRDPRGTFLSQYRVGEFMKADKEVKYGEFCDRMLTDLKDSIKLSKRFRDRILIVRYEDIVQYPIASAKFMYDFVGLHLTDKIKEYIWNITYAGKNETSREVCQMLCTTRTNSTDTAYQWRNILPFGAVQMVDRLCSKTYSFLGYRTFSSRSDFKSQHYASTRPDFGEELKDSQLMTLKKLKLIPERKSKINNF